MAALTAEILELLRACALQGAGLVAMRKRLSSSAEFVWMSDASSRAGEIASLMKVRGATTAAAGVNFLGCVELLDALSRVDGGTPVQVHQFGDRGHDYAVYLTEARSVLGVTAIERVEAVPIDAAGERVTAGRARRIQCPRCRQDWLHTAVTTALHEAVVFCPECEATWPHGVDLSTACFEDLATLLEKRGLPNSDAVSALGLVEVLRVEP